MRLLKRLKSTVKSFLGVDRGPNLNELREMGMRVGENFIYDAGSTRFDSSHCWLIEIGDNVTFGPGVYLLAHDASTKKELGYTKIGKVKIGDRTFVGANSIVMPGVSVGENCIIGAASVVTHDVESNSVYVGNPARYLCSVQEYYDKQRIRMEDLPKYDVSYTIGGGITNDKKQEMINDLKDKIGFVV